MEKEEIKKLFLEILDDQMGYKNANIQLYDDSDIMEALFADSLDIVEIIMAVEERFDIYVDDDKVEEEIRTVHDAIEYIYELKSKPNAS